MLENLRNLLNELKALRREISKEPGPQIAKKALREHAEACSTLWFSTISPELVQHNVIASEVIECYSALFAMLLKLSRPNNLRTRYLAVLRDSAKTFNDDLIAPIQTEPRLAKEVSLFAKMLLALPDEAENVYLNEAVSCATKGFLRASAVLGWCAAIDRIHRTIEKVGFAKFNTVSQQMASATSRRFKRFKTSKNVSAVSELREDIDSNIL